MQTITSPSGSPTAPDAGAKPHDSTQLWELTRQVLDLARGLVVAKNPFLSAAIGLLEATPASLATPFACDGASLYVDTAKILAQFKQERSAPVHDLTHVLLHCLMLHPFASASVDSAAWDLACDIVTESLVISVAGAREGARGKQIESVLSTIEHDLGQSLTAERLYRALRDGAYETTRDAWATLFFVDSHTLWASSCDPSNQSSPGTDKAGDERQDNGPAGSAAGAAAGDSDADSSSATRQQDAGAAGNHAQEQPSAHPSHDDADGEADGTGDGSGGSGTGDEPGSSPRLDQPQNSNTEAPRPLDGAARSRAEKAWSRAAKSMRVDLETISRNRGAGLGNLVRELEVGAHERMDYRTFLRQFAVEHEDMRLSDDEFDYIFYTYGLSLYGNVPLVEPLEYRSDKRIRDFVIVIDTSSSVTAKVVQEFVDTTFDVLSSEGGFFQTTNIHIIQADARVQSDAKITSVADLDRWRRNIKLYGFGGTDFRPAFRYVQQLRQAGEFDDLQGLIYFTDGWGIYPERMPPYRCAFVFYDEDHRPELVPPWAIQLVLHPGEYESLSVY